MVKTDILTMAAKNLMRRKSRTVLTMLGVLIGTTSIVVMVSLGIGMMESQQKMYEQWGSLNEITVNQSYSYGDNDTKVVALNDEALEIFKQYEGVTAVIPMVRVSANGVKYGKEEGWLEVYGIDPASMEQKGIEVASGRLLEAGDQNAIVVGVRKRHFNRGALHGKLGGSCLSFHIDQARICICPGHNALGIRELGIRKRHGARLDRKHLAVVRNGNASLKGNAVQGKITARYREGRGGYDLILICFCDNRRAGGCGTDGIATLRSGNGLIITKPLFSLGLIAVSNLNRSVLERQRRA